MPGQGSFTGVHAPVFSSDGRRIVFNAGNNIYMANINGGTPVRLLPEGVNVRMPAWSPDDQWIAFYNFKTKILEKLKMGTAAAVEVTKARHSFVLWSPDGKWISAQFDEGFGVVSPDGNLRKILRKGIVRAESACGWSRDGSRFYIASPEQGRMVLYEYDVDKATERRLRELGQIEFGRFGYAGLLSPSKDGNAADHHCECPF